MTDNGIEGMTPNVSIPEIGMPDFGVFPMLLPIIAIFAIIIIPSLVFIGPKEVGLMTKKLGKSLPDGQILAFNGEAGYQAKLLKPGVHIVFWALYRVKKCPLVQTTARGGGVIMSQIGTDLPTGAKTAEARELTIDNFTDPKTFLDKGGQKGIQRIMIGPSSTRIIHPIAFLVKTTKKTYGEPIDEESLAELNDLKPDLIMIGGEYNVR